MIRRRAFVTGLGAMLASPFTADGQALSKVPRIGVLDAASSLTPRTAFHDGLRQFGYVEGSTITIERWAGGMPKRFSELAVELVRLKVDVIVATNNAAVAAAQAASLCSLPIG